MGVDLHKVGGCHPVRKGAAKKRRECVCWGGGPGGGCNRKVEGRKDREGAQETVNSPGRREGKDGWEPGRWGTSSPEPLGSAKISRRAEEVQGSAECREPGRGRPRGRRNGSSRA